MWGSAGLSAAELFHDGTLHQRLNVVVFCVPRGRFKTLDIRRGQFHTAKNQGDRLAIFLVLEFEREVLEIRCVPDRDLVFDPFIVGDHREILGAGVAVDLFRARGSGRNLVVCRRGGGVFVWQRHLGVSLEAGINQEGSLLVRTSDGGHFAHAHGLDLRRHLRLQSGATHLGQIQFETGFVIEEFEVARDTDLAFGRGLHRLHFEFAREPLVGLKQFGHRPVESGAG